MDDYTYEYCNGDVKEHFIPKEVSKHKSGFKMLENVPVGICDKCGYRYYHSSVLLRVDDIANGIQLPERIESIPVVRMVS